MEDLLADQQPTESYFDLLVGPGHKFKDQEELAKGKYHSDLTIELQNKRYDQLRADYEKLQQETRGRATLEQAIDQLHKAPVDNQPLVQEKQQPSKIELKDIDDLVSRKLHEREVQQQRERNFSNVKEKLVERFGSDFASKIKPRVDDLGINVNEMAQTQPKVLLELLGVNETQQRKDTFQTPPTSEVRQSSFKPHTEEHTWNYYQNLSKTNPDLYRSPKIQNQMIDDAIRLGDKFGDGDWEFLGNNSFRKGY